MKKTLFLLLSLLLNVNISAEHSIEKSGFYIVHVKSMPYWTFWNYSKVINTIAACANRTPIVIQKYIDLEIPVLYTWNYDEALECKSKAAQLNAELEIREIQFISKDKKISKEEMIPFKIVQLTEKLKAATSADQDLDSARDQMIKILEKELI